jgi:hypothetical protein
LAAFEVIAEGKMMRVGNWHGVTFAGNILT